MNKVILKLVKIYIRLLFPKPNHRFTNGKSDDFPNNEIEFKDSRCYRLLILFVILSFLSLLVIIPLVYN